MVEPNRREMFPWPLEAETSLLFCDPSAVAVNASKALQSAEFVSSFPLTGGGEQSRAFSIPLVSSPVVYHWDIFRTRSTWHFFTSERILIRRQIFLWSWITCGCLEYYRFVGLLHPYFQIRIWNDYDPFKVLVSHIGAVDWLRESR